MTEKIEAQIILTVRTANGLTEHGIQFDLGNQKTKIVCQLCKNKLTTNNTLREHAQHVLTEHSEIFKPKRKVTA